LGLAFVVLQASEYYFAPYQIADSVFGTVFYSLTGLHGLHVIAGVTFLFVCFCRMYSYQLTKNHHVGFVFAIYYWHLVDVVWILVYALAYIWGANCSYKGYS
jgi:heme/copper-type cytochrome/quinol oxidase subunit 3